MPDKPPSYSDRKLGEDLARRAPVYDAEHDSARRPKAMMWVLLTTAIGVWILFGLLTGKFG